MSIEKFRVPQRCKNQLVNIKRAVGIENWNVLCRWALALSLREETEPSMERIAQDSNVEMTWKTFGGSFSAIYQALIRYRYRQSSLVDKIDETNYFLLHLKRGISYLQQQTKGADITALYELRDQ